MPVFPLGCRDAFVIELGCFGVFGGLGCGWAGCLSIDRSAEEGEGREESEGFVRKSASVHGFEFGVEFENFGEKAGIDYGDSQRKDFSSVQVSSFSLSAQDGISAQSSSSSAIPCMKLSG